MMYKVIEVAVLPGHREAFLAGQHVWDRECRKAGGYIDQFVGDSGSQQIHVITRWKTRAAYEEWMTDEHDRIAALAGSDRHYSKIVVSLIDGIE